MRGLQVLLRAAVGDRYGLERALGEGGMAVVFLARDVRTGARIALKVLKPEFAASLWASRFLREIEIASHLVHPHIVPVLDSGSADALLYYTMPYLEGESLDVRLARHKPVPLDEALEIIGPVADALEYAHVQGFVHRDIKPGNILLTAAGAMVTDFGIARAICAAGGEALTMPGLPLGTMGYMSPEQAAGLSDLDGRTDVYGLACVLHEMLAGCPPRSSVDGARSRYTGRPSGGVPDLGTLSECPDAVIYAIAKALSLHPADRFPSAAAFVAALTAPRECGGTSVAVLPFVNTSPEPGNSLLGDAVARAVIEALSAFAELRVASHTASFACRDARDDVRAIGAALQVGAVVDGSVRQAGGMLRVTAQLASADTGVSVWSEHFDCPIGEADLICEAVARTIAGEVRALLTTER